MKNPFMLCFIVGMTTGMGNGSVFGAAMMCFLGRAEFNDWGGWASLAYNPVTFDGFVNWAMFIFGFAFYATLHAAVNRHNALEQKAAG